MSPTHRVSARRAESTGTPFVILGAVTLVLYFAREVFIPLALALTISFLLQPVVSLLEKVRISRVPAVALATLAFLAGTLGLGWIVAGQLLNVTNDLPQYRANI